MLRNLLPFPTCPELGKRFGWPQTKSHSAASNLRTSSDVPPLKAVHQSLRYSMTMHKRKPWHMEADQRSQLQLLLPSGQDYQRFYSTLTPSALSSPAQAEVMSSELTLPTLATVEFVVTSRNGMPDLKLAVVGSHKKLGSWHAQKGLSLRYYEPGRLSARVTLEAGIYEFKVAGLSDDDVIWETGKNRIFQVPDLSITGNDKILVVNCRWDDTAITAIDLQQQDTALLEPLLQLDSMRQVESEVPRTLEGHIDTSAFQGKLDHANMYLASLIHKQKILQERMQRLWRMALEQEQLYDSLLARMPSDIYQLTIAAAAANSTTPSTLTPPFSSPPTSPPPPFSPAPPFSTKHRTSDQSHQHTIRRKGAGVGTTFNDSSQLATSLQKQVSAASQAIPSAKTNLTSASYRYLPAPPPFSPPQPSGTSSVANPPDSQSTSTTHFPLGKDRKHSMHTELVIELDPLMFTFPTSERKNARHSAEDINPSVPTGDLSCSGSAVGELPKSQLSIANFDPSNEAGNVDTVDFGMCWHESRSEMHPLVVELPALMFSFDADPCDMDSSVSLSAGGAGTRKVELSEEGDILEPSSPAFGAWLKDASYDVAVQMTELGMAKDIAGSVINPLNNQPFGLEPITFSFLPDGTCDIVFPEVACTSDDCRGPSLEENEAASAFVEIKLKAEKEDVVASVSQLGLVPVMETVASSCNKLELNSQDGLLGCVGLGEYTSRVLQNLQEELERYPWNLLPGGADLDWLNSSSSQLDPLHTAVAVAESVLSTASSINHPPHVSVPSTTRGINAAFVGSPMGGGWPREASIDNPQLDNSSSIENKPYDSSLSSATMVLAGLLLVNAPSTNSLNLASGQSSTSNTAGFEANMDPPKFETLVENQLGTSDLKTVYNFSVFENMSENIQEHQLEPSGVEPEFGSGTAVGVNVVAQEPGAHLWLRQDEILQEDEVAAQCWDEASSFETTKQAPVFGKAEEQIWSLKRDGGVVQLQGIIDPGVILQDRVAGPGMMEQDVQALYAADEVLALPSTEFSEVVETTDMWNDPSLGELPVDGVWNNGVSTDDAVIDDFIADDEDVLPIAGADFIASLGSAYLEAQSSQAWPEDVEGSLSAEFVQNEFDYVMPSEADWQDSLLAQFSVSDTDYVSAFSENATTAWQDGLPAYFALDEGDYVAPFDDATAGDWQDGLPAEFSLNESDYVAPYDTSVPGDWHTGLPAEFAVDERGIDFAVDEMQDVFWPDAACVSEVKEPLTTEVEQYTVSSAMVPELMALEQAAVLKGTADTVPTFGMALTGMLSEGAVQGYVSAYLPPVTMEHTSSIPETVHSISALSAQGFVVDFDSEQASAAPATITNHVANSSIPININPTNLADTAAQPTVSVSAASAASACSEAASDAVSDAASVAAVSIPGVASDSSYMASNASPAAVHDADVMCCDVAEGFSSVGGSGDTLADNVSSVGGSGDTSADDVSAARAVFVQDMWDVLFPSVVDPDEVYSANIFDEGGAGNDLFENSGDTSMDADWNQFSWLGNASTDAAVFELNRVSPKGVSDAGSDASGVIFDVFGDETMLIQQPQMQAQIAMEIASGSSPCTSWPLVMESLVLQNNAELALCKLELAPEVPTPATGETTVLGTKGMMSFDLGLTAADADAGEVEDASNINRAPVPSSRTSRNSLPDIISSPGWNDLVSAFMQSLQSSKEQNQARTAFHDWIMQQPRSKTWPSKAGPNFQQWKDLQQKSWEPVPSAKLWKKLAEPLSENFQEKKLATVSQLTQMQQQIQEAMQHVSIWKELQNKQLREVSASQLEQMQQQLSEALQSVSEWNGLQLKQFREVSASQLHQMEQLIQDRLHSVAEWRQQQVSIVQLDQMQQQLHEVLRSISEWKELQQQQLHELPASKLTQVQEQFQETLQSISMWQEMQHQQLREVSTSQLDHMEQLLAQALQSISEWKEMQQQQMGKVLPTAAQLSHMQQLIHEAVHSISEWKELQQQRLCEASASQQNRMQQELDIRLQAVTEWSLPQLLLQQVLLSSSQLDLMQQQLQGAVQAVGKWNLMQQQLVTEMLPPKSQWIRSGQQTQKPLLDDKEDSLMQEWKDAEGRYCNLETGAGTGIVGVPVTTSGLADNTEVPVTTSVKDGVLSTSMAAGKELHIPDCCLQEAGDPCTVGETDLSALTPTQMAQMEALLESAACFAALYQQLQAFQGEKRGEKDPMQLLRV